MPSYVCQQCGKAYNSRSSFSIHVRSHTGESPYKCCGKPFWCHMHFKNHRCIHHGAEKSFTCEICNFSTGVKSILKTHMQRVHVEPAYTCDECGSKFKTLTTMNDHVGMHSGINRNICHCGKSYRYSSGLSKHKKKCKPN